MKIKGITFWEQHLEKIVVGVAVAVFVALTAMQFIGNPSEQTASGAPGGKVDAHSVDNYLRARAQQLLDKINAPNPPEALPAYMSGRSDFEKGMAGGNLPDSTLPPLAYDLKLRVGGNPTLAAKPYVVPQIPAPEPVAVGRYAEALLPETVQAIPELAALFPAGVGPYDLSFTTALFRMPVNKILAQFSGKELPPDQADRAPVPFPWHENLVLMLDAVIEREELVDGQYTNRIVIDPLPGDVQLSFRSKLNGALKASERDAMLAEVRIPARQLAIIQPEFYPTKRNGWHPPEPDDPAQAGAVQGVDPAVLELRVTLSRQKRERERTNQRLTELGGPAEDPADKRNDKRDDRGGDRGGDRQPPGGGGIAPPGSGGGSGISGGGGGKRETGGTSGGEKNLPARMSLTKKLKQLDERIAGLQKKLDGLQGPVAAPGVPGAPGDKPRKADVPQQLVIGDDGFVDIWGHDITAKPGHTYRYRLTVKVYNPFFGRRLNLIEAQRHLADQITLDSPPSAWSEDRAITPWVQLFASSAKAADRTEAVAAGRFPFGHANFEVYRFYDGTWFKERFAVTPGDRVGGKLDERQEGADAKREIDYTTGYYVVDVAEDIGASGGQTRDDALVYIQDIAGAKPIELRRPNSDKAHPDRVWLEEQVQLAREELLAPPPT